jgi:ABC-type dipeptide/oligopeptide/nickel transport system permease component
MTKPIETDIAPFDAVDYLDSPEMMAAYLTACMEDDTPGLFMQALSDVARAKGMTEGVVLFRHVLRNAMIPILTNIGLQLPGIFVGSFLIEVFFSIPGLGREVLLAVNRSDFPVIQAVTIYLAVLTMGINLLTDVAYKIADPRVVLK